jgi:hypothetical protein
LSQNTRHPCYDSLPGACHPHHMASFPTLTSLTP